MLEGLRSAAGGADIAALDAAIGALQKRQFMLVSAKDSRPRVFGTRWAMSYLRGPLTKEQVQQLMSDAPRAGRGGTRVRLRRRTRHAEAPPPRHSRPTRRRSRRPPQPGVDRLVSRSRRRRGRHRSARPPASTRLRAFLATRVALRYDDTAAGIDEQQEFEALYGPLDGGLDLDAETVVDFDDRDFRPDAPAGATYVLPAAPIGEAKFFAQAGKDVQARLVANRALEIFRNKQLKLTSRPGETEEAFLARCDEAGQAKADAEAVEADASASRRSRTGSQNALELAQRRVEELDTQTKSRQANELIAGAGAVLGALFGGKRSARSITNAVGSVASKHGQSATSSRATRAPPRRRCSRRPTISPSSSRRSSTR